VLEWITWGGGGLGDPLTRPASIIAREVHRRLVSVAGAKNNYGVVVHPQTFAVEEEATKSMRASMREERGGTGEEDEEHGNNGKIDRGGTLSQLLAQCEEETGHYPPRPQWEGSVYGPHAGLEYVRSWFERMKMEGKEKWDRA
jgi:5-oxoprolinase (ATP-hydrolysing)